MAEKLGDMFRDRMALRNGTEEKIKKLYKQGENINEIAKKCNVTCEHVDSIVKSDKTVVKKEKREESKKIKVGDIREIEKALREKDYRKAYRLARRSSREGLEQCDRAEIAKLEKKALLGITIQQAQKKGKDAEQIAKNLGIRVSKVVDLMGIKVEQKDGTVVYKTREELGAKKIEEEFER